MTATPIVDRVIINPLAVPPDLDRRLRRTEREARDARDRLRGTTDQGAFDWPPLEEAFREVDDFLEDRTRSPLIRLLSRPLAQLRTDGPAWRSFERRSRTMLERCVRVTKLYPELNTIAARLERMRAQYSPVLPRYWVAELNRARLTTDDLKRIRTDREVQATILRLDIVQSRLDDLLRLVPSDLKDLPEPIQSLEPAVTRQELIANAKRRIRERSAFVRAAAPRELLVVVLEHHLAALAAGGRDAGPSSPAEVVAQHLANETMAFVPLPNSAAADHAVLGGALLRSAERNRARAIAWRPSISRPMARDASSGGAGESQYFVVPIDEEFVLITQKLQSAVRVWSTGLAPGREVRCRVFGRGMAVDSRLASFDVAPLFEGFSADYSVLWEHERYARVSVLFEHGGDWYGRLERLGKVRQRPRRPGTRQPGSLEVLRPAEATWGEKRVRITAETEAENVLGFRTSIGTAAVPGFPSVLVRSGASPVRLETERWFFMALAQVDPLRALHPLGRASHPDGGEAELYHVPVGLAVTRQPAVGEWLGTQKSRVVRELLRLAAAAWRARYAVGAYHYDLFRIGVSYGASGLRPRLILAAGPFSTMFGDILPTIPVESARESLVFEKLCFRGIPPALGGRPTATPELDAVALGCLVLDVLAKAKLPSDSRWLGWHEMLEAADAHSSLFKHPWLARRIVFGLQHGRLNELVSLVRRYGVDG